MKTHVVEPVQHMQQPGRHKTNHIDTKIEATSIDKCFQDASGRKPFVLASHDARRWSILSRGHVIKNALQKYFLMSVQ